LAFMWILERVSEGKEKWLWGLPAITLLWTNLHGGFFVGVILVGGYGLGELTRFVLDGDASARGKAKRYLLTSAACLAGSLINPYTYQLHVHVVEYLTDSYQKEHINEFFSLNFHHPVGPFFEFLVLTGACAAVWHFKRGNYRAPILIAVWTHGALLSMRNIPL